MSVNVARLRVGELVAGGGALLLTIMLFLNWAQPELRVRTAPGVTLSSPLQNAADSVLGAAAHRLAESGWSTLGWLLVLMLLVAIVGGFGLVALTLTERDTPVLPVVAAVTVTTWSLFTAFVLFLRLTLFQPGLSVGLDDADVNVLGPAWFGLLGLVAIAAGGWLTLRDDRLDSPLSAPPEVTVRPTPPPSVPA